MSSIKPTTLSDKQCNQNAFDAADSRKWKKVSEIRPGDTISVQGTLPCGKLGRVEVGVVLNSCLTIDGTGSQALVSTGTYGRRWFGAAGGPYRILGIAAKSNRSQQ